MTEAQGRVRRPPMNRRRVFAFVILYLAALFLVTSTATCKKARIQQEYHRRLPREQVQYLERSGGSPLLRKAEHYRALTRWFALSGGAFAVSGLGLLLVKRSR